MKAQKKANRLTGATIRNLGAYKRCVDLCIPAGFPVPRLYAGCAHSLTRNQQTDGQQFVESLWPVDKNAYRIQTLVMRLPVIFVVVSAMLCPPSRAQVPVFQVTPIQSSIRSQYDIFDAPDGQF